MELQKASVSTQISCTQEFDSVLCGCTTPRNYEIRGERIKRGAGSPFYQNHVCQFKAASSGDLAWRLLTHLSSSSQGACR
mmetsp:Transcript_11463/g.35064  ORF Transcript_11463/g.35064 Transcript_11463/m.35064 type:complete len:80 (+) Transcript_11463:161-400(+)